MHREEPEQPIDPRLYAGMILLGIGSFALLYVTVSVIQMIRHPEGVGIINWLMKTVENREAIISGEIAGGNFQIQANEAFQYVFLALVGLIILRIVTSIFMTFIKEGTALMVPSKKHEPEPLAKGVPPQLPRPPAR